MYTKEGANRDMQVEKCSTDAEKRHGVPKCKRNVSSNDVDDLNESQDDGQLQHGGNSNKGHALDDTTQDSESGEEIKTSTPCKNNRHSPNLATVNPSHQPKEQRSLGLLLRLQIMSYSSKLTRDWRP